MSHRRDVSDVRILWIDHDARNGSAVFQSDVGPMFTAVGCSIDAVPPIGGVPVVRFAAPNPNDVRIGRRNCNRADGKHGLFVENWIERNAAVARLENAAVSERDIKHERIARIDRNIGNAPTHDCGTDRTRLEILEEYIGPLRRPSRRRWRYGSRQRWSRTRWRCSCWRTGRGGRRSWR